MGMFYRTIRLIENGLKPVYVFDGKPPDMKSDEVCRLFFYATLETLSLLVYFIVSSSLNPLPSISNFGHHKTHAPENRSRKYSSQCLFI